VARYSIVTVSVQPDSVLTAHGVGTLKMVKIARVMNVITFFVARKEHRAGRSPVLTFKPHPTRLFKYIKLVDKVG
jgi:hypothetical protein